ncbi:MAG: BlaI/MecI/CopY family transcriptional regulator [Tannerella sp.]|jgi:predicted transcriptional regulator|nr:BlaI/MecI/CopY family transcriptional regulator [Tannerella sp.]
MKRLTAKEEEIMSFFWDRGPLFVKQIHDVYSEQKPHYNTLSTIVRGLEEKGFLGHTAYGNTHQYYALFSKESYRRSSIKVLINKYFNNSYNRVVAAFIEEEELTIDELKSLIREVEEKEKHKQKQT